MNSMLTTRLRQSGGSVVMAVPKTVMDLLGLKVGAIVGLDVVGGTLVVSPHDPARRDELKETPELLALLAKVHAETARTSELVRTTLANFDRDDRASHARHMAIVQKAKAELTEDDAHRIIEALRAQGAHASPPTETGHRSQKAH